MNRPTCKSSIHPSSTGKATLTVSLLDYILAHKGGENFRENIFSYCDNRQAILIKTVEKLKKHVAFYQTAVSEKKKLKKNQFRGCNIGESVL